MGKILIVILMCCCLNLQAQYKPKKKYHKESILLNEKFLTIAGGSLFVIAGNVAMRTRGLKPFRDNGTPWKISPSEFTIIGGFSIITFGIIYKF
jgi:hypothetical protein|tara:strand:- start:109 stop:390 length:282 start_codon:yes stop_codon:yes gene_type:complete